MAAKWCAAFAHRSPHSFIQGCSFPQAFASRREAGCSYPGACRQQIATVGRFAYECHAGCKDERRFRFEKEKRKEGKKAGHLEIRTGFSVFTRKFFAGVSFAEIFNFK